MKFISVKFIKIISPIMIMGNTTIAISNETKNKISSFGTKGESYDTILKRIYSLAVKEHLREFLMSDDGFIPIEEAIKEADKKWPK